MNIVAIQKLRIISIGALFIAGFLMSNTAHAQEFRGIDFLHDPAIEIVDGVREKETFNFELSDRTVFSSSKAGGTLNVQIDNVGNGDKLTIDYQAAQSLSLREFTLRFNVDNQFDTYYRLVAGQWEVFELGSDAFFGQELILFDSQGHKGILVVFDEPYGKLQLKNGELAISYLDGRAAKIDGLHSDIYFSPISQVGTENNLLYESKFPDGKESIILYSADDLHAVFDEKFVDRIKYFDLLKEKDPTFKTTFLIVADVFRKRGEPVNTQLVSELKSKGYINFGYHGVYHAYPVDDPINPVIFDDSRVDFNGTNSKNRNWLQDVISKGVEILTAQGFDYSVFRAPQYQYSDESFESLADNGVHLAHICQGDIHNPIRVSTAQGWLWKVYDNPCNKGYVKIENGKGNYDTMDFSEELALNGKETSFHVHIWELWSGDNPYDGNAEYHTFDRVVNFLAFLGEKDIDYNWQYAADYYRYLESLRSFDISNQQQNSDQFTATLKLKEPLQTNIYLKLFLKDGQFIKNAHVDGKAIKFSQKREKVVMLEIPFDVKDKSVLVVEFTDNKDAQVTASLIASPARDIQRSVPVPTQKKTQGGRQSEQFFDKKFAGLDLNVVILLGLFVIYSVMFLAGLLHYRAAKKNA